jgi:hypothetical protein
MQTRVLILGEGFAGLELSEKEHFGSSRRLRWFGPR